MGNEEVSGGLNRNGFTGMVGKEITLTPTEGENYVSH